MLVSVFIPTYNAVSCIDATLESVLSQSYADIELWIVDDCSTDGTPELLSSWASRDSRVNVLLKERNEGFVPYSWNRVFSHLRGEFTIYMSHDDQLRPGCIETLVRSQQETGADCVIPKVIMGELFTYDYDPSVLSGREAFARMLNYDIPGFALWRTSLIREIGMPTEAWNSDEGMQRIWAVHCQKVALCPSAVFYYYLTPASITKGLKPYHITGLKTQYRLMSTLFCHGIWYRYPVETCRFMWHYLKSIIYLRTHKGV